jgi:hypothetical protein
VIVLASAYVIGVVVDRLADSLIGSVGGLWSDRRRAERGWPKEAEKRLRVLAAGGSSPRSSSTSAAGCGWRAARC